MRGMQDLDAVRGSIEAALGHHGAERPAPAPLPDVPWQPHSAPRAHVFVDRESQHSECAVLFKAPRGPMDTPSTWLEKIKVCAPHVSLSPARLVLCAAMGSARLPIHCSHRPVRPRPFLVHQYRSKWQPA